MDREPQWIVALKLNVWVCLALVPLFITHANSKLDKPAGREITKDINPGFISIDCGESTDYVDGETGIWYQTDKDFVETGMNHAVSPNVHLNYPYFGRLLRTLRSFPDGDRNCYTLKPKQGANNSYLIRAFFAYGNYDFKNQTPSFDLYIGVDYVETIGRTGSYYYSEVIHTPRTDTIYVCLVKTGPTIPYISSLELRLLNSSIYQNQSMSRSTPPSLLYLQTRFDMGAPAKPTPSRYKDDVYDRLWRYYYSSDWNTSRLNDSVSIDPGTPDNTYKLPAEVLRTASQSMNVTYTLKFDYDSDKTIDLDKSYEYYVFFHFDEIEKLPPGKKRIINITLNSKNILSQPLVLEYLKPVTILNAAQGYVKFRISATSESYAPPILNALEIYRLLTNLSSPTDTRDGMYRSVE